LSNRAHIASGGNYYLSPLPKTGNTAKDMPEWITTGIDKEKDGSVVQVFSDDASGKNELISTGYEFERTLQENVGEETITFQERVFVIRSQAYVEQQLRGLEKRMKTAQKQIAVLTPPVGRGKRQIVDEEILKSEIAKIINKQQVEGLLHVEYERQSKMETRYIGKGRGSSEREKRTTEKVRYQINAVKRNEQAIIAAKQRFGWKAYVTNAAKAAVSLSDAVLCYRKEYRIERIFNRIKGAMDAPCKTR
jgi:transposase